jgi:DNA-binding HxlR family transcriptional regulator
VERTLQVLSGKWKAGILFHLLPGTRRFGELQRLMPEATRQMLTAHLRELEEDGLIHRQVYAQVPPKVEYSLTALARRLGPVFDEIYKWGVHYLTTMNGTAPLPKPRRAAGPSTTEARPSTRKRQPARP